MKEIRWSAGHFTANRDATFPC